MSHVDDNEGQAGEEVGAPADDAPESGPGPSTRPPPGGTPSPWPVALRTKEHDAWFAQIRAETSDFVWSLLRGWHDASPESREEAHQDIYQTLDADAVAHGRPKNVRGKLYTITWHAMLNHRRVVAHRRPREDASAADELPASQPGADARLEDGERRRRVEDVLLRMKPKDREVIRLVDLDELTCEEAASALGIGEEAVKKRHQRALRRFGEIARELYGRDPGGDEPGR